MVRRFCISYQRRLVDACRIWSAGIINSIDYSKFSGYKSWDGKPGEEFEDGVRTTICWIWRDGNGLNRNACDFFKINGKCIKALIFVLCVLRGSKNEGAH